MTDPAREAGSVTLPGTDLSLARMGYGAMQLVGPGVFGPPHDPDAAVGVTRSIRENCTLSGYASAGRGVCVPWSRVACCQSHTYSPVRMIFSHPSGATCSRCSSGTSSPSARMASMACSSPNVFHRVMAATTTFKPLARLR